MENLPRPKSVGCLSLKLGCIITALLLILHSVLALSQCFAALLTHELNPKDEWTTYAFMVYVMVVQSISFTLNVGMLIGALREKPFLIKPWVVWNSIYLAASLLMLTMSLITQLDVSALYVYIAEFFALLIRFYMLTIVASFHIQLVEEQTETVRLRKLINADSWYTDA